LGRHINIKMINMFQDEEMLYHSFYRG
jgi:hypothetical protein